MDTAGFVLAGGASSRMGRDKAFVTFHGRAFIEIVADAVLQVTGSVTIIGPPHVYERLGYPVIPDLRNNAGPLAGIETALSHTAADWNLVIACDMPRADAATLRRILDEALAHPECACILPQNAGLAEPLCAAYRRRLLPVVSRALDSGVRKIISALPGSAVRYLVMEDQPAFQNINTPEELRAALQLP
jgi:molybdopterin-guanine dinucleotide biosynthesis protein A